MSSIAPAAAAALAGGPVQPGAPTAAPKGEDRGFAAALEDAARSAVETLGKAETTSMQAAAGDADLLEVVTAVNDAEATLKTVVAVRDKVMQSYQEILRMPI